MFIGFGNTGGASLLTDLSAEGQANEVIEVEADLADNVFPKDTQVDFALIDV